MVFSIQAWRDYCLDRVEANTIEQKDRLKRLLDIHNPDNQAAWTKLATDVKHQCFVNEDGSLYVVEWPEALHQVIGTLIFPPTPPTPTPRLKYKKIMKAALALQDELQDSLLTSRNGQAVVHNKLYGIDEILESSALALLGAIPLPLMPGKSQGINAERNWIVLYLKYRVIAPFFNGPHHEDIARLVNSALGIDTLTPEAVRLLKPRSGEHP